MYMISVIVPVYNVEKYLKDCVESILNQTYTDFELILVNDGSTDLSGQMCDDYAQKSDKVIVIHKSNGGQNSAIKSGLQKARGEYIAFVDSDDWLEPNALEKFYDIVKTSNVDLVVGNAFRNDQASDILTHKLDAGIYDKEQIRQHIFPNLMVRMTSNNVSVLPARWGKLFKKDLLMQVVHYCDDEISRGEEKLLTYPYIIKCETIAFTNERTYHYRYNAESVSHRLIDDRMGEQKRLIALLGEVVNELTDYDFTNQLEAMTIMAVDMTIGELRYHVDRNDKKAVYNIFKKAVMDASVSKKVHPYPRRLAEHIKFHLIMKRRVVLLWLYSRLFLAIKH